MEELTLFSNIPERTDTIVQRKILISLLLVAVCGGIFYGTYERPRGKSVRDKSVRAVRVEQAELELSQRVPVPNNRSADVLDGYRGEIHPLLFRHAEMEVKASWDAASVKMSDLLSSRPAQLDEVRRLLVEVRAAVPTKSYSERDFSGFLPPDNVKAAGQIWDLDPERVAVFLKQFHPAVSAHSASVGRRPGPDGAFAVLRGVSSSYLDIAFRAHAEFDLAPKADDFPALYVWYTPAYFLGRIVVNRSAGTVKYFQLSVPTDEVMNIHSTVWVGLNDHPPHTHDALHQHLRADRMELVGGSLQGLDGVHWEDQIETSQALDKLAKVFYKFKEIDFVPFPKALATARAQHKPIFAVVALGALDDQGC